MNRPAVAAQTAATQSDVETRVGELAWEAMTRRLDERGFATTGALLTPAECEELIRLYPGEEGFRKVVVMARHGYGRGEYKYFDYPLPALVEQLRTALYARLASVANRWAEALQQDACFPTTHAEMRRRCHDAGQMRATPLLLKYEVDDFNCLHQDVYGDQVFPLQAAFLLSRPGVDFQGGEFLLTEQRPRMQSRGEVVPLEQGEGVVFAVRWRPEQGKRGWRRVQMRHGVSRIRKGRRWTLGVIFHDAK